MYPGWPRLLFWALGNCQLMIGSNWARRFSPTMHMVVFRKAFE
jgi:hypothetical protein